MIGAISPYDNTVRANYTFVLDLISPINDAPYLDNDSGNDDKVVVKTLNATTVIEPICCLEEYAVPRIKSITTLGQLIISWDRQMMQP